MDRRWPHAPCSRQIRDLTKFFLACAFRRNRPASPDWVSVVVVGNREICAINTAVFRRDQVTDVISQRYQAIPGVHGSGGEVTVNAECAGRPPLRPGWDSARELALYLAHGVDHLTDADDHAPEERRRMRRRELGWLRAAAKAGLIEPLRRKRHTTRGKRHTP